MRARRLEGVKVGDKIKVRHQWGNQFDCYTVDRVTATRAVCGKKAFAIDSGLLIGTGDGWRRCYGSFATDEDFARAKLEVRIKVAQDAIRRMTVTPDNLESVESLLKASQP